MKIRRLWQFALLGEDGTWAKPVVKDEVGGRGAREPYLAFKKQNKDAGQRIQLHDRGLGLPCTRPWVTFLPPNRKRLAVTGRGEGTRVRKENTSGDWERGNHSQEGTSCVLSNSSHLQQHSVS